MWKVSGNSVLKNLGMAALIMSYSPKFRKLFGKFWGSVQAFKKSKCVFEVKKNYFRFNFRSKIKLEVSKKKLFLKKRQSK